ncbi:unnamed protein product, partial [Menidia menidia]
MAAVDEFLREPSEEGLERCTREQLLKIAEHFQLEVGDKRSKDNIRAIIKANLTDSGVLGPTKLQATSTWLDAAAVDTSLTFEQKRELLLLQASIEQKRLDVKKMELEELGQNGFQVGMFIWIQLTYVIIVKPGAIGSVNALNGVL